MPNTLDTILDKFEKEYGGFNLCEVVNQKDHDRLLAFLKQSCLEYAENMIGELTWNHNDVGVKELEDNVDYIKVSDLKFKLEQTRKQ